MAASNSPPLLVTDPVCFRRTSTGDLLFPLELATGLEAVGIGCRTRVLNYRGEWFLNLGIGVAYLPTDDDVVSEEQAILGQPFNPAKVRREFMRELLTCPGVDEVSMLSIDFAPDTAEMTVRWIVSTRFGDTPVDSVTRSI